MAILRPTSKFHDVFADSADTLTDPARKLLPALAKMDSREIFEPYPHGATMALIVQAALTALLVSDKPYGVLGEMAIDIQQITPALKIMVDRGFVLLDGDVEKAIGPQNKITLTERTFGLLVQRARKSNFLKHTVPYSDQSPIHEDDDKHKLVPTPV